MIQTLITEDKGIEGKKGYCSLMDSKPRPYCKHPWSTRRARRTTYKSDDGNRNTGTPVLYRRMPRGTKLFRGDDCSSDEENKDERESGASRRVSRPPSRREGSRSSPVRGPGHIRDIEREEVRAKKEKIERSYFMLELGLKTL